MAFNFITGQEEPDFQVAPNAPAQPPPPVPLPQVSDPDIEQRPALPPDYIESLKKKYMTDFGPDSVDAMQGKVSLHDKVAVPFSGISGIFGAIGGHNIKETEDLYRQKHDDFKKDLNSDFEQRRQALLEKLKDAQAQKAATEENDPNSRTSRAMRLGLMATDQGKKFVGQLGPDFANMSAAQLKMYPQIKDFFDKSAQLEETNIKETGATGRSNAEIASKEKEGAANRANARELNMPFDAGPLGVLNKKTGELVTTDKDGKPLAKGKQNPVTEDLRKELMANPVTKQTLDIASSYKRVKAATATPAGDISLIYGYMKLMDPGSSVREGEFATAQNAGSVPSQIQAMYNKVLSGQRLAPGIRKDFLAQADNLYNAQVQRYRPIAESYRTLAAKLGADPADVDIDLGLGGTEKAAPATSGNQPKTVVQNGHTYTLNEATGQYE